MAHDKLDPTIHVVGEVYPQAAQVVYICIKCNGTVWDLAGRCVDCRQREAVQECKREIAAALRGIERFTATVLSRPMVCALAADLDTIAKKLEGE